MPYAFRFCVGCGRRYRPTKGDQKFHNRACSALNAGQHLRSRKTREGQAEDADEVLEPHTWPMPRVEGRQAWQAKAGPTWSWWAEPVTYDEWTRLYQQEVPRMTAQGSGGKVREVDA